MMMGMWHVMIFFGNYTAGQSGEMYGSVDPASYFTFIGALLVGISAACFIVVRLVKRMMHGVNYASISMNMPI